MPDRNTKRRELTAHAGSPVDRRLPGALSTLELVGCQHWARHPEGRDGPSHWRRGTTEGTVGLGAVPVANRSLR
jgi:hypothetical protein